MALQHINSAGLSILKRFEGLRLTAYSDAGGTATIGWGHTRGVVQGDKTTAAGADIFLAHDVGDAEDAVNQLVSCELNPNQFSALVCLVFNIGETQFAQSSMLKLLNAGEIDAAANEFHRWNNAGGQQLPGLTRRRQAEEELYRRPVKPLSSSRTIQAGTVAASGSAISIASQLYDVRDSISSIAYEWKWGAIAVAVLTLIAVGFMVYARIDDHLAGSR